MFFPDLCQFPLGYPGRSWFKSLVSKVNFASALSWGSWATSSNFDFVWFCTPETVVEICLNHGVALILQVMFREASRLWPPGHSTNEQTSRHGRLKRHAIPNRSMYYIHLRYITYIYIFNIFIIFANMYYIYIWESIFNNISIFNYIYLYSII